MWGVVGYCCHDFVAFGHPKITFEAFCGKNKRLDCVVNKPTLILLFDF